MQDALKVGLVASVCIVHHCQHGRNKSKHYIVSPTMRLGVVASFCTWLKWFVASCKCIARMGEGKAYERKYLAWLKFFPVWNYPVFVVMVESVGDIKSLLLILAGSLPRAVKFVDIVLYSGYSLKHHCPACKKESGNGNQCMLGRMTECDVILYGSVNSKPLRPPPSGRGEGGLGVHL